METTNGRYLMVLAGWTAASMLTTATWAQEAPRLVKQTFAVDPLWEGFRNRLLPERLPLVRQDFGYRDTNYAGGKRAGEIGGFVQRSPLAATYGLAIEPRTLDQPLFASGKLAVRAAEGPSGVMIGWFRDTPSGWRTPNSLAMRLDGNGGKYWVFYEYGTRGWRTGGGGAFEGERYQTTPTPPFQSDGTVHDWAIAYDPAAAAGQGEILFRIDDRAYRQVLAPGHRQEGATFNRFGIWNVQAPGDRMELYLDDLTIDGQTQSFDVDPWWIAVGNPAHFNERILRPHHDFGASLTSHVLGEPPGEIGGIIFRDERPAYYAAAAGKLSLEDELVASGKLALVKAASDSGVYVGWFNAADKQANETPEYRSRQKNYLGFLLEGPSRVGHYFRPGYGTRDGAGLNAGEQSADGSTWPVVYPDARTHAWSIRYRPTGAEGRGTIEVIFDGQEQAMDLAAGHRILGAEFDRFGIFNMQSGGHHVELYLDEVSYSSRSGKVPQRAE